jgi:hypothetical protein
MDPDAWHMSLDEEGQQEEEDCGQHGDVDMPIPEQAAVDKRLYGPPPDGPPCAYLYKSL